MKAGKLNKVFHRDFLGAHRYTTGGGTARSAEGVLRTAVVCRGQPRGDAALSPPVLSHLPFLIQRGRRYDG